MSDSKLALLWAALRAKCEAEVPREEMPTQGSQDDGEEMLSQEWSQPDEEMPSQDQDMPEDRETLMSQDEAVSDMWSQGSLPSQEECEEMRSQEPDVGDVVECTGAYGEEVPSLAPGETAVYSQDMDVDVVGTTDPIAIECACSGLISETPKLTTEVRVQTEVEVDCDKTLTCISCGSCKYADSLTASAGEGM